MPIFFNADKSNSFIAEMIVHQPLNYHLDIIDTDSGPSGTLKITNDQEEQSRKARTCREQAQQRQQQPHAADGRWEQQDVEDDNDRLQDQFSHRTQDWRHLPADMIFTIASSLDGRSLARLESVDKFTHATIAKHGMILWRALAEKVGSKTGWMTIAQRRQLKKLQQSEEMIRAKRVHPKHFIVERTKLMQGFRLGLMYAQQNRLRSEQYKKRSLALRWYDEVVLPLCLFFLFTLFVIFLIYQLETNDGSVTWMTMSPLLIFCGLITLSTCMMCTIQCRVRYSHQTVYRHEYDTNHLLPNHYLLESKSFISPFLEMFRLTFHIVSLIFLGLLTCIIFLSLRVTGTIDWSWPLIFTPFFVATGLVTLLWCIPRPSKQSLFGMFMILAFSSPIIAFVILLTIYLNNGGSTPTLHLQYVFIPLYLIDALTFLYICLPTLIIFLAFPLYICLRIYRGEYIGANEYFPLDKLGAIVGWIVFIGPCLYVKIVLGLRADGGGAIMSNLALFLPLLIPILAFSCIAVFLMPSEGVFRDLRDRLTSIETETRRAAEETKVPSTIEAIENDERFVLPHEVELPGDFHDEIMDL